MEIPQTVARDSSDVVVMSILESRVEAPIQKPQTQPRKKKTVSKTKRNVPEEVEVEETPAQAPAQTPGVRDLLAQYKEALRAKIDSHKFYPTMSRRMGQRGTAIVAFTLLKDGHIINARVLKSSGFSRLDDAAKVAVTSVREFDPIPDEIGVNSLDLEIPVKFTDNI
jgi:periplasmic protein TonB